MEYVVWGTGFVAYEYIGRGFEDISFFIDNDKRKQGDMFYGKKILGPEQIDKWKELYIIIAVKDGETIETQLKNYGLQHGENYKWYYENVPKDDFSCMESVFQDIFDSIREHNDWKGKKLCLNTAIMVDYVCNNYFQEWNNNLVDGDFLYIVELGRKNFENVQDKIPFRCIELPDIFSENVYSFSSEKSNISNEIIQKVNANEELRLAAVRMRKKHMNAQPDHEYGCIYYYYHFFLNLLRILQPQCLIIQNTFMAYHSVAEYACQLENIPVVRTEYGVLPGTLTFESMGEMGESAVAIYANEFCELTITDKEYEEAGRIWSYISESGINRKVQWKGKNLEQINNKLIEGRPTVFFAGQNDMGSGIYPYTERGKSYHSPNFRTSIQAAIFLADISRRCGWNFIFKPHPYMLMNEEEFASLPGDVILVKDIGVNYLIDLSDVTVTIASQSAYIALLRNKPTLLLGYIQLKGKKCAYEAYEINEIETELKKAIKDGFTIKQKKAFQKHIAQLVKYYLYDSYEKRPLRYGRSCPKNMVEILQLENTLKAKGSMKK